MKKIIVCPVCYSTDITLDTGGITGKYMCKNCGYVGSVVLELTEGEYRELIEGKKFERDDVREKGKKPTGVRD